MARLWNFTSAFGISYGGALSGTTIQLTETGYDYFDSKERQRQTFYKGFARRLEQILPYLIHPNQNGYIKGRSMHRLFWYSSGCGFRESFRLFKSYHPP